MKERKFSEILRSMLIGSSIIIIGLFSTIFLYVFVNSIGTKYLVLSPVMLMPIIVSAFAIYVSVKKL